MLTLLNSPDKIKDFSKGICFGEDDLSIDAELRIRLSSRIHKLLNENGVNKLWRFPAITFTGVILCPPEYRNLYIEIATTSFLKNCPKSIESNARDFISPGFPKTIDAQGRVSLTQECISLGKIRSKCEMTIVGVGCWYEVWHQTKYISYKKNLSSSKG